MHDRFTRAAAAFRRLCEIMAQLRAPNGCPWDAEQTLQSLKPYLVEEAYEALAAIDSGDDQEHCRELGDLLLQIVFQAEITQAEGRFDVADVADAISDKLVRRHPHVFGDAPRDSGGTLASWEAMKAKERPASSSCLDGVPPSLPALLRAQRTGDKAAAVGFDWPDAAGPVQKIEEEWRELQHALRESTADGATEAKATDEVRHELGDLLFSVVNLARHIGVDAEDALRLTIGRFQSRFRHVETSLAISGRTPKEASLDELNALWEDAKTLGAGSGANKP